MSNVFAYQGAYGGKVSATAVAVASSGTIATKGLSVTRVNPAAAVTAVILEKGEVSGQVVTVVNEATGANSVTFAATGTSFVADGASTAIAGLTSKSYVWNATAGKWFVGA
jgi:hypothetical protein